MLLAVLLLGISMIISFQLINKHRLTQYMLDTSNGTLQLIAEGLSRHQNDQQQEWLNIIQRLSGLKIDLSLQAPEWLNTQELTRLQEGKTLVIPDIKNKSAALILKIPEQQLFLSTRIKDINEQLSRLSAQLVLNELGRTEKNRRMQRLEQVQLKFGFPVHMIDFSDNLLDFSQQRRLVAGDIVVNLNDTTGNTPFIQVFARIGNSGQLLSLGPIPLFNWFPPTIIGLMIFSSILILGIINYLLVRPLEKHLAGMEKQVENIGTRLIPSMPIRGDDALSRFAGRVNQMAVRIHSLLQEQTEITHAISHELRTPLARIKFRLATLEDKVNKNALQNIRDIQSDIDELNSLIDELLTFAQLKNSQTTAAQQPFDLHQLLQELVQNTRLLHPALNIQFECISSAMLTEVSGIPHLIKRAIQNLLNNACRHAVTQVKLSYEIFEYKVSIRVEDDGPGIPQEHWDRIFHPFARLDKSRNRASGGYGLGLAIVQQIAQTHQGSVSIDNSSLNGAGFNFYWEGQRVPGK